MTDRTYAIVVGIENYNQKDSFSTVPYARKDARDFADTLVAIGVPVGNIRLIEDQHGTKASIEAELTRLVALVQKGDRGIFYFAGHGAYVGGNNVLVPVDGYRLMTDQTCVSVDRILGMFKQSRSSTWLLFLDCCHSGFRPGNTERGIDERFEAEELIRRYRDEEYLWGFASCGSHQSSVSHAKLSNGVWTHYLINAFGGKAKGIYEGGLLFSDTLQAYLGSEVTEFVKMNTEDRDNQNPVVFGSQTGRFIIADLNPIFAERRKIAEEKRAQKGIDFTRLTIASEDRGEIKSLPGFAKSHRVPTSKNRTTDQFVKGVGDELVAEATKELIAAMKNSFGYKRRDVNITNEPGDVQIVTPDFTCYVSISQDDETPTLYLIQKSITEIKNPEIIQSNEFDKAFEKTFDRLVFSHTKKIDIEQLIDKAEDLSEEQGVNVEYDDQDLSWCRLKVNGVNFEILVTPNQLSIISTYAVRPNQLVEAFRETATAIGSAFNLILLN